MGRPLCEAFVVCCGVVLGVFLQHGVSACMAALLLVPPPSVVVRLLSCTASSPFLTGSSCWLWATLFLRCCRLRTTDVAVVCGALQLNLLNPPHHQAPFLQPPISAA